jgi:Bacterial Ig domain
MRLTGFKNHSETKGADGASGEQRRDRSFAKRRSLVLLACITVLLLTGVSLAAAGAFAPLVHPGPPAPPSPPEPPTPTITARPADPTSQRSAHFAYADAQSGVSYQCQLDGGSFNSCPAAGVTYGPFAERSHTFKVRALAGAKTSSTASYSWTIDTTPPTSSISFPGNGDTLAAADWGSHCPGRTTICGSARDAGGVSSVVISIQRDGGQWWGGSAFDQSAESFRGATLDSPERDSTRWSYSLRLPPDGAYTIHVRAVDEAGNKTIAAAQTTSHFAIDTTPPPAPSITAHPPATTTARSASFGFSDSEHAVTLLCRRDGGRFERCTSPTAYGTLGLGSHSFQVQARDAAGNTSASATYSWTIAKEVREAEGKPFTVTGNASGPLAPGLTRSLSITLTNPNNVAITVTALSASIAAGSSKAGCDGPSNLQLTQSSISEANSVAIAANGHVTLPSAAVTAPQVLMKDLPVNQDACKGASFTFTYAGSAHS